MNKKKSLILAVGLVGLILGSTLLYNVLAKNYEENQDNIIEQNQLESEEIAAKDVTSKELETKTSDGEVIIDDSKEDDLTSMDSEVSSDTESPSDSTSTSSKEEVVSPTQGASTPNADTTASNQDTTTPNQNATAPSQGTTAPSQGSSAPNQGITSAPEQEETPTKPTIGVTTPTNVPTKAPTSTPAPTATPTPTKTPTKVNTAPDFTVQTYSGNKVSLSSNFGKPIVVNFWASWCGPCKSEMPDFNAIYKEYKDKVVFMMVDMVDGMRETKADGYNYVTSQGFSFPVYYDVNQSAAYAYGITSYPTTYFIDANGNVSTYSKGAMSASTLRNKINQLINE